MDGQEVCSHSLDSSRHGLYIFSLPTPLPGSGWVWWASNYCPVQTQVQHHTERPSRLLLMAWRLLPWIWSAPVFLFADTWHNFFIPKGQSYRYPSQSQEGCWTSVRAAHLQGLTEGALSATLSGQWHPAPSSWSRSLLSASKRSICQMWLQHLIVPACLLIGTKAVALAIAATLQVPISLPKPDQHQSVGKLGLQWQLEFHWDS